MKLNSFSHQNDKFVVILYFMTNVSDAFFFSLRLLLSFQIAKTVSTVLEGKILLLFLFSYPLVKTFLKVTNLNSFESQEAK